MPKSLVHVSLFALAALAMSANAQAPRTAWGKPDLTGVWTNASLTTLSRPAGKPLVVDAETARKMVANPVIAGVTKTAEDSAARIDPAKLNVVPERAARISAARAMTSCG